MQVSQYTGNMVRSSIIPILRVIRVSDARVTYIGKYGKKLNCPNIKGEQG